jgi:hypothetical protein
MDPDPVPDPDPDPTSFSLILSAKEKNYFFVKMVFCRHYFTPLNTFMRKGKDLELDPDPDPHL